MPNVQTKTLANVWQRLGKIMWPKQPMLCVLRSQNGCTHMGWPSMIPLPTKLWFKTETQWNGASCDSASLRWLKETIYAPLKKTSLSLNDGSARSRWSTSTRNRVTRISEADEKGEKKEGKKRSKIKRSGSVQKFAKRQSYTSALKAVIFSQIVVLQRELHSPEHKLLGKTTSSHTHTENGGKCSQFLSLRMIHE